MKMNYREKLYFLLDTIQDLASVTPSGQPLALSAMNDLNNRISHYDLELLFSKLEKDEKVLKVLQTPNRIKNALLQEVGRYREMDDNRYHFVLLPSFDQYFLKIQQEPEYCEFTGKRPNANSTETTSSDDNEASIKPTPIQAPVSVVISDLKSRYGEIEQETDTAQFYMKIAQYGKYILENEVTKTVLAPLYQEAVDDADTYLRAWKEFVDTWKLYAQDLLEKAEQADIKDNPNNPLSDDIARIKNKLGETETSTWETDLSDFFLPYQMLIWKFSDQDKIKLLTPKHLHPEDKTLVIYESYNKARDEWDKFKFSRETKVWWAHYQICRLVSGILSFPSGTVYFKRDNFIDSFYKMEFDQLARGSSNGDGIVLHAARFKTWIKRLHDFLLPRLEVLEKEPTPLESKPQQSGTRSFNRRDVLKIISTAKKTCELGKKEKSLLSILSDFKPHKISELEVEVPTKACSKLKETLSKKIKHLGLIIETPKSGGLYPTYFYQLNYLPPSADRI